MEEDKSLMMMISLRPQEVVTVLLRGGESFLLSAVMRAALSICA